MKYVGPLAAIIAGIVIYLLTTDLAEGSLAYALTFGFFGPYVGIAIALSGAIFIITRSVKYEKRQKKDN